MGFRNPMYSLRLQPSCFTYGTVGISKSGLKLCEFFLESKNFHLEPDNFLSYDLLVFRDLLRAPQCLLPSRYSTSLCLFLSYQPVSLTL